MPLSKSNQTVLREQQGSGDNCFKKRKLPDDPHLTPEDLQTNKRIKEEMSDSQKKANFSAVASPSNGFSKHSSPMGSKPGSAKKLVIKNFKGMKDLINIIRSSNLHATHNHGSSLNIKYLYN